MHKITSAILVEFNEKYLMFCFVLLRFGWIDEHFAVIPRSNAVPYCGQNQTGLVTWRASVTRKFDVFCFNESGMTFLCAFLSRASHCTLIMHALTQPWLFVL